MDKPLVQINQKLHFSVIYNGLQLSVNALAIFTGASTTTMKCFVAGTMILTAAGLVAIENIKTGNKVISTNPETFEVAEKTVLETYVRETTELVHLTINGELIKTTHDHPFYVKDVGFVSAGELYIGDKLLDSNGNTLLLEDRKVENLDEPVKVYNFQVEDFHTYHVGENGTLVHNSECGGRYGSLKSDKDGKLYESEEVHHTPAKNSSHLSERDGPAIRMEKSDHRQTASCGRSKEAQAYRDKQRELIDNGKFIEAVQMDIDDIRSKFGDKYDKGIEEMLEYVNELYKVGKI